MDLQAAAHDDLSITMAAATLGRTAAYDETGRMASPPSHLSRLARGAVISGRYTVQEVLGEGGMGVVYRVGDALCAGREVALKILRGRLMKPHELRLFEAEFRTMTLVCGASSPADTPTNR